MIQVVSTKKPNEKKRMGKALELSKTQLKFHVREKEESEQVFRNKTDELAAAFFNNNKKVWTKTI